MKPVKTQADVNAVDRACRKGEITGQHDVTVSDTAGLLLRTGKRGAKWFARATLDGRQIRVALGDAGGPERVTLDEARHKAAAARAQARDGHDPRGATAPATMSTQPTVSELIDAFLEDAGNRRRWSDATVRTYTHGLASVREKLGDRKAHLLTRRDVIRVLKPYADAGKDAMVGVVRRATAAMFTWAVKAGKVEDIRNPAHGLPDAYHGRVERDHVLSVRTLARLYRCAGGMAYPWGPLFQAAILTGRRRSVLLHLRWEWQTSLAEQARLQDEDEPAVDVAYFDVPSEVPGAKGVRAPIVLAPMLAGVLDEARGMAELTAGENPTYVFGRFEGDSSAKPSFNGDGHPDGRVVSIDTAWAELRRRVFERYGVDVSAARMNDIRRSLQTHAGGASDYMLREKSHVFTGHKIAKGVEGVYQRASFVGVFHEVGCWWEAELEKALAHVDQEERTARLKRRSA